MRRVTTESEASALAADLLDRTRMAPIAVVSTPMGRRETLIDVSTLIDEVGDVVDVVVIETGPATWVLTDSMPPLGGVYGGAGRVYPTGLDWTGDPKRHAPLRLAYGPHEGARATQQLVADALGRAAAAGLFDRPGSVATRVVGEVIGIVASRAMVRHPGGLATIVAESSGMDVDLEHLIRPGMTVTGRLDANTRRLDVRESLLSPDDALAHLAPGDVLPTQVVAVEPAQATFALHPRLLVTVTGSQITGNPLDRLATLLTPGEVVLARVVTVAPHWGLSLIDVVDDDPVAPGAALLPGGPPWLDPPAALDWDVEAFADAPIDLDHAPDSTPAALAGAAVSQPMSPPAGAAAAVATPAPDSSATPTLPNPAMLKPGAVLRADEVTWPIGPAPGDAAAKTKPPAPGKALRDTSNALAAAKAKARMQEELALASGAEARVLTQENAALSAELHHAETQLSASREESKRLRTQLRKVTGGLRRVERVVDDGWVDDAFTDAEQRFRFEVELAWARRIPAPDKVRLPVRPYSLGPEFLDSLSALEGIDRSKVVDVVVEVVTGLVEDVNGRELHPLRTAAGGGAPARTREDGATCWRAALQVNTPSARRLHFWRGRDVLELSRVATHDDMAP